ncbi:MAG: hypothetical protein WCL39_10820, partial [Armatimonadota bacterium]
SLVLFFALLAFSCSGWSGRNKALVGNWQYEPVEQQTVYTMPYERQAGEKGKGFDPKAVKLANNLLRDSTLQMREDHTFTMRMKDSFTGRWKAAGQNLLLKPDQRFDRKPIEFTINETNDRISTIPEAFGMVIISYRKTSSRAD